MGALTGNTVQSTYLDLVQLGQSGAGLPLHAGKEAALYDGSGAQILGRTSVRHWLDPDPDAIAGTWEFSTYGDATQGELETAGWVFADCTAEVKNGRLCIVQSGANKYVRAYVPVNLSGDFDYAVSPGVHPTQNSSNYLPVANNLYGGFGVAASGSDLMHHVHLESAADGRLAFKRYITGAYSTGGGTNYNLSVYSSPVLLRIARLSGTVRLGGMHQYPLGSIIDESGANYMNAQNGVPGIVQVVDATAFNRLVLLLDFGQSSLDKGAVSFAWIRRYK